MSEGIPRPITVSRTRHLERQPHFVYELWGPKGECLYIGCTSSLGSRLNAHAGKEWWHRVLRVEATLHETRAEAQASELEAIRVHEPTWNTIGTPWGDQMKRDEWARRKARK